MASTHPLKAAVSAVVFGLAAVTLTACGGGSDDDAPVATAPAPDPIPLNPPSPVPGATDVPSAATLCATQGVIPRLRNAAVCDQPERSPVVALGIQQRSGAVSQCSGVVVSARQVLTAAHCLSGVFPQAVWVTLWKNGAVSELLNATRWVVHPSYQPTPEALYNDVAVLSFGRDLPNPPMPVLTSGTVTVGQRVYLSGWGNRPGDASAAEGLGVGYANIGFVNDTHVGFVYDGLTSNTCGGDSGGPLYVLKDGQPAVVGLTSSGTSATCSKGDRSLFTRLLQSSNLAFLKQEAPQMAQR